MNTPKCPYGVDCRDATLCGRALEPGDVVEDISIGPPDCFASEYHDADTDATDLLHMIAIGVI
jgi:hypothetical protein